MQPYELWAARLLCPWDSPGKNTRVHCHALLQGIFPTQGSNPCLLWLLHCRRILYCWPLGKPCSHDIKRCFVLGGKATANLDSILESRDFTLLIQVHIVEAMIFPVGMYRYESWTIKMPECQRIDAFKLWCWRRLLNSKEIKPVNSKGNQPCIFIIRTEAEALILWPSDVKRRLIGKDPDARKH